MHHAVICPSILLLEPREELVQFVVLRDCVEINDITLGSESGNGADLDASDIPGIGYFRTKECLAREGKGVTILEETHLRLPDGQVKRLQILH